MDVSIQGPIRLIWNYLNSLLLLFSQRK
jgi:hypothetical protein